MTALEASGVVDLMADISTQHAIHRYLPSAAPNPHLILLTTRHHLGQSTKQRKLMLRLQLSLPNDWIMKHKPRRHTRTSNFEITNSVTAIVTGWRDDFWQAARH